jgi:hypothetical protein
MTCTHRSRLALLFLMTGFLFSGRQACALGEKRYVLNYSSHSTFTLAESGHVAPVLISSADWPGVRIAAQTFCADMQRVTGHQPAFAQDKASAGADWIIAGTIGKSPLIDDLIRRHKLDVSGIAGKWEAEVTAVVEHPLPEVERALVIAGSDKRGTIFGIYDLSEQIGVSPWYWWADVPVPHSDALYMQTTRHVLAEPAVQYRGIFLNDEAPALSGWVHEKFGGFNHLFYEHVFELLLRLKANLLWPAMWGSAFNEDDPLNPKLADEYGIVMGTSHHEPMMRAQQEWKRHGTGPWDYSTNAQAIDDFWREGVRRNRNYEELTTIGMRGDGDVAMSATTNTKLLERIVADQRRILAEEVNPDVTKVPQVWALYKEVQSYYEAGMRVPDDVTLLWCDDNWGNIRRLPTPAERERKGGAGIYYHFDYVGDPRSYKWLNVTSLPKVQEQMRLALDYGTTREWIVNVGDLKPMEFPIEFFLSMARTPERWTKDTVDDFTVQWATREFGAEHAREIASIVEDYTRYNSRRTPELLTPDTYSLTMDHEADRVDHDWRELTARAEAVNAELPADARPAFFELVLYPVKASATVGEMYIAAGRNRLYAKQGRASANDYADETQRLFALDASLSNEYNHALLNGRWDHMMDQTHIGYTFWNEPPVNAMPAVQRVQPLSGAHMAVFPEGGLADALPAFDSANRQVRTIDLADRGAAAFRYTATASAPWILMDEPSGEVSGDKTLHVSIDWTKAPASHSEGTITLQQEGHAQAPVVVRVAADGLRLDAVRSGFVADGDVVTIDADHPSANLASNGVQWQQLPGYGPIGSGMEAFPTTAPSTLQAANSACLDYSFDIAHAGSWMLQAMLSPTASFVPGRGLRYSIAVDKAPGSVVDAWADSSAAEWSRAVGDGVHRVTTPLGNLDAGWHTLHVCRVDPGVVLERFLLYRGAAPATYLGPPESVSVDHGVPTSLPAQSGGQQ